MPILLIILSGTSVFRVSTARALGKEQLSARTWAAGHLGQRHLVGLRSQCESNESGEMLRSGLLSFSPKISRFPTPILLLCSLTAQACEPAPENGAPKALHHRGSFPGTFEELSCKPATVAGRTAGQCQYCKLVIPLGQGTVVWLQLT